MYCVKYGILAQNTVSLSLYIIYVYKYTYMPVSINEINGSNNLRGYIYMYRWVYLTVLPINTHTDVCIFYTHTHTCVRMYACMYVKVGRQVGR